MSYGSDSQLQTLGTIDHSDVNKLILANQETYRSDVGIIGDRGRPTGSRPSISQSPGG